MGKTATGVKRLTWEFESTGDIYPSSMHTEIMSLLRSKGTADSDFDAAELIYGELIGNLIRHASGKVTIQFEWSEDFPTLSVSEEQGYATPAICLPSDPLAESGRGLFIVKALARDFTVMESDGTGGAACAVLPVKRRAA